MRLAIISDIHANLEALQATFQAIECEVPDQIVCLGDIVGYNASPGDCIALLRARGALCVAGNHDRAVTGQLGEADFPGNAARSIAWTRRQLDSNALDFLARLPSELVIEDGVVAVHGALHTVEQRETLYLDSRERRRETFAALAAHPARVRMCAFGHTHHAGVWELSNEQEKAFDEAEVTLREGAFYLVNPGSVGQPRSVDTRASFMVFDCARGIIMTRRVAYDAQAVRARNREAGLLPPFAWLPAPVRSTLHRGAHRLGLRGLRR